MDGRRRRAVDGTDDPVGGRGDEADLSPRAHRVLDQDVRRRNRPTVDVLAEPTVRRVPLKAEKQLRAAGVSIRRFFHPEGLPMHAKFALIDGRGERRVVFGSFNWTERSRRFNCEIGVIASEPRLFDSFEERWEILRGQSAEPPGH